jgi:hypothetical protein
MHECTNNFPVYGVLGNPYSYTRIPILYGSVGRRACSPGFLEEFFSETDLRGLRSSARGALMPSVGSVLRSMLAGVAFVGPTATYILLAQ